jgi:hypothetical protein
MEIGESAWWNNARELALRGLAVMFNEKQGLFCYRTRLMGLRIVNEGFSRRYSLIALIGLHRLETLGIPVHMPINRTLDKIAASWGKLENAGDFGLLLWASALISPSCVEALLDRHDPIPILQQCRDAREGLTTELSWLLTGLSVLSLKQPRLPEAWEALARRTYQQLMDNCGASGLFGHMSSRLFQTPFRARIGCFADQAYPIYALSKFAGAFNNISALIAARRCGEAILSLQGEQGQWWWQYDSLKGEVAGYYPVYSVHQDGMAPMALHALSQATNISFDESVEKSLAWISGRNELQFNMLDFERNLIWRAIRPPKWAIRHEMLCRAVHLPLSSHPQALSVWYECRPYHLGWLIYAFADRMASAGIGVPGEQIWTMSFSGSQQ